MPFREAQSLKRRYGVVEICLGQQQGGRNKNALRAKECLEGSQKMFWETLKAL